MLNLNSILVFSQDYKKLVEFYSKVFNKPPDMEDDGYAGFLVGKCFINFGNHDKVKGKSKNPERILINLETNNVKEEFVRIKKLGAAVIAEPYSAGSEYWIATFADPDGNYFQLVSPWKA